MINRDILGGVSRTDRSKVRIGNQISVSFSICREQKYNHLNNKAVESNGSKNIIVSKIEA